MNEEDAKNFGARSSSLVDILMYTFLGDSGTRSNFIMGKEVEDFKELHPGIQVISEDIPISHFELHWESQFLGKQQLLP